MFDWKSRGDCGSFLLTSNFSQQVEGGKERFLECKDWWLKKSPPRKTTLEFLPWRLVQGIGVQQKREENRSDWLG